MAKYRPVDVRLWNDRKFLSLSEGGRMLWLFLLTAPSTLPIPGVIVAGDLSLAEQLGWSPELFRERFAEVLRAGLSIRREGRLLWLRNGLRYQPPANPNVIKGWSKTWDDVPECDLKHELWKELRSACSGWSSLFSQLFPEPPNGSANHCETEPADRSGNGFIQEQEQEQSVVDQGSGSSSSEADPDRGGDRDLVEAPAPAPAPLRFDRLINEFLRRVNEARNAIAAEHEMRVRPITLMDGGSSGERDLRARLQGSADPEGDLALVLDIAIAEANSTGELRWLSWSLASEKAWRTRLASTVAEAGKTRVGPKARNPYGYAEPRSDHPVSEDLVPFGEAVTK